MEKKNNCIQFGFAIVTSKGLMFEERFYSNSRMIKNKWFEFAAREGEWIIPVLYQPSNHKYLVLFDNEAQEVATAINNESKMSTEELSNYFGVMHILKDRFFNRGTK